jgi:chromosome segregation ATPase
MHRPEDYQQLPDNDSARINEIIEERLNTNDKIAECNDKIDNTLDQELKKLYEKKLILLQRLLEKQNTKLNALRNRQTATKEYDKAKKNIRLTPLFGFLGLLSLGSGSAGIFLAILFIKNVIAAIITSIGSGFSGSCGIAITICCCLHLLAHARDCHEKINSNDITITNADSEIITLEQAIETNDNAIEFHKQATKKVTHTKEREGRQVKKLARQIDKKNQKIEEKNKIIEDKSVRLGNLYIKHDIIQSTLDEFADENVKLTAINRKLIKKLFICKTEKDIEKKLNPDKDDKTNPQPTFSK